MAASPASENTPYFDAPIIHFQKSQSPPPSMKEADSPAQSVSLTAVEQESLKQDVQVASKAERVTESAPTDISKDGDVRRDPIEILSSSPIAPSPAPICSQTGSKFIKTDGQHVNGSTFIGGAATTGPNSTAEANDQLDRRAISANASLTPKQRSKIEKAQAKDGKRLSKIIKEEAKAEKKALAVVINELADLQKFQKQAIKTEEKAHSTQTKVLAQFLKEERAFLAARTKYNEAQARLQSEEAALEKVRSNARDVTERLQEKSQEVNILRTTYAVDERERAIKLAELAEHSSGCC